MSDQNVLSQALENTVLTRRTFLKWSAALGGTAALASSGIGGLQSVAEASTSSSAPADGKWITAACWHDCGGRCPVRAYVVDGVVQRTSTDDSHPDSPEFPQQRSCVRGRSQRGQIFGADRIKYPMKRKNWAPGGGDKSLRGKDEWVRISWDEALTIVANETIRIREKYGNKAIFASGSEIGRTLSLFGGYVSSWGSTSWGTWYAGGLLAGLYPAGTGAGGLDTRLSISDRFDLQKSQLIVFWGLNPAVSSAGLPTYNFLQAKKAGAKFIFVDPVYNSSAVALADEWIPIRTGTDHALVLGMAYTLLTQDKPGTTPLIDWDFLNSCTVGFDATHMPQGADPKENFKDYVLGTFDGQPKTPEWAAEICGVPPAKIRSFALEIATTPRATLLNGWAPARINNGDSWPQAFMTLGCMTGHVGQPGRNTGCAPHAYSSNGGPTLVNAGGTGVPAVVNPLLPASFTILPKTAPTGTTINNAQLWEAVLSGKYTAFKNDVRDINIQMIYHGGSSALNQKSGLMKGIQAHRKVEFVVTQHYAMNTSAKYSDVVLPITTQWERYGWLSGATANREIMVFASQVTDPLFEAKDDIWVAAEIGKRLGLDPKVIDPVPLKQQIFNQVRGTTVIKQDGSGFEPLVTITAQDIADLGVTGQPQQGRITFQELKNNGFYQVPRSPNDKLGFVAFEAFRKDPVKVKLSTASGKLEIYCQDMKDLVDRTGFSQIRAIPTYNKATEGYEDTFSDFANKVKSAYPLQCQNTKYLRRAHSTLDNVPWLREAYPQEFWMNSVDAAKRGIQNGDTVKVTSRHGTVVRPAYVTDRIMPGITQLGEGAWAEIDEATGFDKAGAVNTLCGDIPTGQGNQGWNTVNVQVEKYTNQLDPDSKWAQRIVFGKAQGV